MPDDNHWDDETNRRLEAVREKAMRSRPRVDQTLTTPATTAEAVADSVGVGTSTGAVPERVAPMAGHPSRADGSRGGR